MVDIFGTTEVFVRVFQTSVNFGEIIPGHVREFIVANGGRVSFGVVFLDESIVGFPSVVGGVNFSVGILFVEQFGPRFEACTGFNLRVY